MRTTRRRWLSFNLRTLFALVTVLGVAGGFVARERAISARQQQIVESYGDRVVSMSTEPCCSESLGWLFGKRVTSVAFRDGLALDLRALAELTELKSLIIRKAELDDL